MGTARPTNSAGAAVLVALSVLCQAVGGHEGMDIYQDHTLMRPRRRPVVDVVRCIVGVVV